MNKFKLCIFPFFSLFIAGSVWAEESRLILISPHWEGIRYEYQWAFQDYYKKETGNDISFTWLDVGGTSEILRFVRSEFERNPKSIGVDLFFGGGVEPYDELSRLNYLEPYRLPPSLLDKVPREIAGAPLIGKDFTWYAPVLGSFGILCNQKVLNLLKLPLPLTWEDVSRSPFHSWVASTDPRKSGSGHMIYEIILQAYGWERGWEILFAVGRNIRSFGAQSNQPVKDAEAGEVACAFAYDTQAWWAQQKYGTETMPYILPENLTVIAPDAVGILKGAPHPREARLFINFLLSPEGQRLWIRPKGSIGGPRNYDLARMPALPEIYLEPGPRLVHFNPFSWNNAFNLDAERASKRWNILNDLLGTFIVEHHEQLRKREVNAPFPAVPSEQEILALSEHWNDAFRRDEEIRKWKETCGGFSRGKDKWSRLLLPAVPCIMLITLILLRMLNMARKKRLSAKLYISENPGIQ